MAETQPKLQLDALSLSAMISQSSIGTLVEIARKRDDRQWIILSRELSGC
jgi:hypothetical protein